MKNLKLMLGAVALLGLSMTACTIEYTCTCDTEAGEIIFDIESISQNEAEDSCADSENLAGYHSCELN